MALEVGVARGIGAVGPLAAVDFDHQPGVDAGEVDDVGWDRVQAAEVGPGLLAVAQDRPQALFGLGRLAAGLAGTVA